MKGKTARKILPEKYRAQFESKTIVCIEYEGLNEDQEREMFQVFSPRYLFDLLINTSPESANGNGVDPRRYDHSHFVKASCDFF